MAKLVEVAQFYDPEEAYCAKGYLRSFGIDTIIQNENHLSVAPSLRIALGGFRLLVMSDQKEDALASLRDVLPPRHKGDKEALLHTDISKNERSQRRKNWFWLPLVFAIGIPFLPTYKNRSTLIGQFLLVILPFYVAAFWSYFGWFGFLD